VDNERRELLIRLGALGLAAPTLGILLHGCETARRSDDDDSGADDDDSGSDDDDAAVDDDDTSDCIPGDASGPANAHGHLVSIPSAHLEDPLQDRTYTSTGGNHPHTFTVSASQLEELRDTCLVVVETLQPHEHSWTITIA